MSPAFEPFTEEECTPEEWKLRERAQRLRGRTAEILGEIEQMGSSVDIVNARIDHMLVTLTRLNIITKEQYFQLVIDSESHIGDQLQQMRSQLRERLELMQAQARKQAKAQMVAAKQRLKEATGSGIIIPPPGSVQIPKE